MKTVLGLTGGSGCGKSLVADYLKRSGAVVIDADKIARQILMPGKPAYKEVLTTFEKIVNEHGTVNRKKLGALVFSDQEKLEKLNAITHKYIISEIEDLLVNAKEAFIVIDAPLLFECGLDRLCTACACVLADFETRKKRIIVRDGIPPEVAENRIHSQNNDEYFRSRSRFVLENNSNPETLFRAVDTMLKELLS